MRKAKGPNYLALRVGRKQKAAQSQLWDMLRYDHCYPVNAPVGSGAWMVFCRDDGKPFTEARWASFGYIIVGAPDRDGLLETMDMIDAGFATGFAAKAAT